MKEIDLAIEMKAKSWDLLMIKAKIFARQKKWQDAIDTMTLSNEMLENDPVQMKQNSYEYWDNKLFLAEWLWDFGQNEKSLEIYRSCFEHNPSDYDLMPPMLRIPLAEGEYSSAMRFLCELHDAKMPKSGHSRLVHAIMALKEEESFHFDIFETARQNEELDMVQAVYNDAVSISTSKNQPRKTAWMQYYQGVLWERYLYRRDDALNIWGNVLRVSSEAVKGTALFEARDSVTRELCNLYIEKVIHLDKGSPVAEKYLQKVKDIVTTGTSVWGQYDTATSLGVLHRLLGQDEQAKKCFRGHVKMVFDLLTDKDPTNDYAAYFALAQEVLVLAGPEYEKDCLAAYSLLGIHDKTLEAAANKTGTTSEEPTEIKSEPAKSEAKDVETTAKQAEPSTQEQKQQPRRPTLPTFLPSQTHAFATAATITDWLFANCDGCDKVLNIPDNTYACTLCLDMNFCSDCHTKLKNKTLGFRICSPEHPLLYIPKAPGPLPKDVVRYDNEYVPILDWLGKVKKTWGI